MAISKERRRLESVVRRLVRAEVNDSWRGAAHPDDREAIKQELPAARKAYRALLDELFPKTKE